MKIADRGAIYQRRSAAGAGKMGPIWAQSADFEDYRISHP